MELIRIRIALVGAAMVIAVGCQNHDDTGKAPTRTARKDGTEMGKCYGNGTCNPGLICSGSNICVKPPPADCQKVALQMSYVILGNYAEPAARQNYVAAQKARCNRLVITKEEGECIAHAKSPAALNKCRAGLVEAGRCEKIIEHILAVIKTDPKAGYERYLVNRKDKLLRKCQRKNPTKEMETCVLAGQTVEELNKCDSL